jgi:hypothetical protein
MTARIHFDDDVYLLQAMLRILNEAMSLDIDPQFFLDKCVEDIFFIDSTLIRLHRTLEENTYLVKRPEYLRSLGHCKRELISLLQGIILGKAPFAGALRPYTPKLQLAIQSQERDLVSIEHALSEGDITNLEPSSAISQEEYAFLFDPSNQDDDE